MLASFFPKPTLFFSTALVWVTLCYGGASDLATRTGLIAGGDAAEAATAATLWSPQALWFDGYFALSASMFAAVWWRRAPHPWAGWSILGTALIVFATRFQVDVSVAINQWYGPLYRTWRAVLQPKREALGW